MKVEVIFFDCKHDESRMYIIAYILEGILIHGLIACMC